MHPACAKGYGVKSCIKCAYAIPQIHHITFHRHSSGERPTRTSQSPVRRVDYIPIFRKQDLIHYPIASQQWRFFTPGAHKAIRSLWRALLPPRATLERANSSLLGPSSLEEPIRAPRGSKLTFRCLHSLNALGARVLPFDLIASNMATTSSSSSITRKDLDQVGTTAFASYLDRSSSHGFSTYSTYSSRKRRY